MYVYYVCILCIYTCTYCRTCCCKPGIPCAACTTTVATGMPFDELFMLLRLFILLFMLFMCGIN